MGLEELKKKKLRLEVDYLKVEWELISTEWRQNLKSKKSLLMMI